MQVSLFRLEWHVVTNALYRSLSKRLLPISRQHTEYAIPASNMSPQETLDEFLQNRAKAQRMMDMIMKIVTTYSM